MRITHPYPNKEKVLARMQMDREGNENTHLLGLTSIHRSSVTQPWKRMWLSGTVLVRTGDGAERRKPTAFVLRPSTAGSTTLTARWSGWTAAYSSLLTRLEEQDAGAGPVSLLLPPLPLPLRLPPLPLPPRPKMEGMAPVCV